MGNITKVQYGLITSAPPDPSRFVVVMWTAELQFCTVGTCDSTAVTMIKNQGFAGVHKIKFKTF